MLLGSSDRLTDAFEKSHLFYQNLLKDTSPLLWMIILSIGLLILIVSGQLICFVWKKLVPYQKFEFGKWRKGDWLILVAIYLLLTLSSQILFSLVINQRFLGDIESLSQKELDQKKVPLSLSKKLKTHKYFLSTQAKVEIKEKGERWKIKDGKRCFIVIKEGENLRIYYGWDLLPFLFYWFSNIGCILCFILFFPQNTRVLGLRKLSWKEVLGISLGYILFLPWYFGSYSLSHILFAIYGCSPPPQEVASQLLDAQKWTLWVGMTTVILGAPILEEVIFRVFFFTSFRFVMNKYLAIGVCSGIFALMHGNLFVLLPIFMLGIFLNLVYERTQSVLGSIWGHILHNGLTLIYLFYII